MVALAVLVTLPLILADGAPLQIAAKVAGCGGSELNQAECVLRRLFAPTKEQALVDANLSRLPTAPPAPIPGIFETLLRGGDGLVDVPLSNDKVAILGSRTGRLPILAALWGVPHVLAMEKEPEPFARSFLALQRLRDLLNNFGDDLVDHDETCKDRAAKGECVQNTDFMATNCTRTCYNRTQSPTLHWQNLEVHLHQGAPNTANLSNVTLAILGEDGFRGPDRKEVASLAMKLESELSPGAIVWSLDPLALQGSKVQEIFDGKASLIPAGGLVFLRRLHLNISWSSDVPCHIYIRVPGPSPALRPQWPLTNKEAKRLQEAATEELVALGAMRLSGAVLSEGRFAVGARAYGANEVAGRRLARAFGVPAAALGSQQDFCRCRPRERSVAYEVSALNLLGMFLLAIHSPESCAVPPCTASDAIMALLAAELRRQLLAGHKESCDVPPQVMRDLGCLRFSDQRTLLHAALGRKDLQLSRAALRSQGAGGLFCRDAFGLTALHHAAQGKPQIRQVNYFDTLERVNSSDAVDWVLKQMRSQAPEMLKQTDHSGRSALHMAKDVTTLRLLADVGSLQSTDFAGRSIAWHAAATNRTDILQDLFCNCTAAKQGNCGKQLLSSPGEDIRVSPLFLASTQLLHPVCGQHLFTPKALEIITNCTGLQNDFNGSLNELAQAVCKNAIAQ